MCSGCREAEGGGGGAASVATPSHQPGHQGQELEKKGNCCSKGVATIGHQIGVRRNQQVKYVLYVIVYKKLVI